MHIEPGLYNSGFILRWLTDHNLATSPRGSQKMKAAELLRVPYTMQKNLTDPKKHDVFRLYCPEILKNDDILKKMIVNESELF